jgi:hypothetical protein
MPQHAQKFQRSTSPDKDVKIPATFLFGLSAGADHIDESLTGFPISAEIGSGVMDRSRQNYTGKLFSELPHIGPDSLLWKQRAAVVETAAPLRCEPPYAGLTPGVRVSDDGETVNMIFTMTTFHGC